jgi:Ca2+-binding RTX toxin-like protein
MAIIPNVLFLDFTEVADTFDGSLIPNTVYYLNGDGGNDKLAGGDFNDTLEGEDGNDTLSGAKGNDLIDGELGNDSLLGGDGNDTASGSQGNDTVLGGIGNDSILGGAGNDSLWGEDGNDTVLGGGNTDKISGGAGNDYLNGETGNDSVDGGAGNDTVLGGLGRDTLLGGAGNDIVDGGAGNDSIVGGDGIDILTGGPGGVDIFKFSPATDLNSVGEWDVITDFGVDQDVLNLADFGLTAPFPFNVFDYFISAGTTAGSIYKLGNDIYIGANPLLGFGSAPLDASSAPTAGIILADVSFDIDDLGDYNIYFGGADTPPPAL